jgi:hypothetical protein
MIASNRHDVDMKIAARLPKQIDAEVAAEVAEFGFAGPIADRAFSSSNVVVR